jgi:hypothetical protein
MTALLPTPLQPKGWCWPLGTGHSSGFNSADLTDVRQRVITTYSVEKLPFGADAIFQF